MKIHVPNYEPDRRGGGWTFTRYFVDHFGQSSYEEADTIFIPSASMVKHDFVDRAKTDDKKIVLRIDNHLLPSRNRNTGMSRIKAFAEKSDLIVYQSKWAFDYLSRYFGKGEVILNGVDIDFFKPAKKNHGEYTYIRSSRINEKGWEMSRYYYSLKANAGTNLNIVGKFSQENIEYNFDFFDFEKFKFWGEQPREVIRDILSTSEYFLYSYFMDACSNTLLEALACGCEIIDVYGMLRTGGAPEIMDCQDISKERMLKEYEAVL